MARKVFHSFHYKPDSHRASQVRNIGALQGNTPVSSNKWEEVKQGGDAAVKRWINGQLVGRTCTIVLIGAGTAGRKWIKYEIEKSWNDRKAVMGIHIHNLKDLSGFQSTKGRNPFDDFTLEVGGRTVKLSSVVKVYDPPFSTSKSVYKHIVNNVENWVETAIAIRAKY
jgi:hypothetical protein